MATGVFMLGQIQGLLMTMRLWDALDILVVAFFFYRMYILVRDTRATALLKGLVFLGLFTLFAGWLQLHVVSWILDKLMTVLIVALPVVFQPELRRALEQLGRGKFYISSRIMDEAELDAVIDHVVEATMTMAKNKVGALIVFERTVGLDDRIDTGIRLEALVSKELLGNIFIVNTPLHDAPSLSATTASWRQAAFCRLPVTGASPLNWGHAIARESACLNRRTVSWSSSVKKRERFPMLTEAIFTAISKKTACGISCGTSLCRIKRKASVMYCRNGAR